MDTSKEEGPSQLARSVTLIGSQSGLVKRLPDFDRKRHTVPRWASDRAQLFLGKLAESELREWGEEVFAACRTGLGYKRREIALSLDSAVARIESKDFVLIRHYALDNDSPDSYVITTELRPCGASALLELSEFNEALGPLFDRWRCSFRSRVSVEDLVDAIESAPESGLSVDYPSDCSHCDATLEGVEALFRFDAVSLEIRFGCFGTPAQLWRSFCRMADSLTGNPILQAIVPIR